MKRVTVTVKAYSASKQDSVDSKIVNDEPNGAAGFAGFAVETFLRRNDVDFILVTKVKE